MRKVLSVLALMVFTLGFTSCETESTADQEQLYIDSPDYDEKPK